MRSSSSFFPAAVLAGACIGLSGAAETAHPHPHWRFSGNTDPAHWAALEHDYETCGNGRHQPPIDIPKGAVHEAHLGSIDFAYQPAPLHVIDNGHTIQVNYAPGSFIEVGEHHSYYHFDGSLTTPPCTEGVSWFVLRNPATLSAAQVASCVRRYPMNARPVQPLDGREIDTGG